VAVPAPTAETRWRCSLCGNLTRFDVERTVRSREYVHVDLAGAQAVDEREVVAETIDQVTCRWCRRPGTVELVPRPQATVEEPEPAAPGGAEPAAGAVRSGVESGPGGP
jgi:hypothetical protein